MEPKDRNFIRKIRWISILLVLIMTLTSCGGRNSEKTAINDKMNMIEEYIDKYFLDEVDEDNVEEYIYKGLLAGLDDPYSTYYTKREYDSFQDSNSGSYSGIGVTVTQDPNSKIITFVKPFVGGPGYEAGILPGDQLVKVDGREYGDEDLTEIVTWLKGEEGTTVDITIHREGEPDFIEMTVTRRKVEVPTVEYQMLDDKVGYIIVAEFDEVTSAQFREAVDDLEKQGLRSLIIDLRNNPGGSLQTVVDMVDRIIDKGIVVYTEDKNGKKVEYEAEDKDKFDLPLAVLINGNSASASEIFAGAVKDYKVGTLVGTTSFGKGIVQRIFPLGDGSAVKLTVSKYFTPNGNNIHGTGIEPDVEIDLPDDLKKQAVVPIEEDVQIQKAIDVLKGE